MEPATGSSSVKLTVIRNGGSSGIAQIEWSATLLGRLVITDVTPNSGNVQFLSGQSSQDIELFVNADNVPEDNMVRTFMKDVFLNIFVLIVASAFGVYSSVHLQHLAF